MTGQSPGVDDGMIADSVFHAMLALLGGATNMAVSLCSLVGLACSVARQRIERTKSFYNVMYGKKNRELGEKYDQAG
jgi:hypothetical protein